jgi:DNA-binding transcriptional regulator YdaS (Cro superfamily)
MDNGLAKAVVAVRRKAELAKLLGMSRQALSQWHTIPLHRLLDVERVTGVPKEELRPDIYREAKPEAAE